MSNTFFIMSVSFFICSARKL